MKTDETYEVVQLLRLNGMQVYRGERGNYTIRLGHRGAWKRHDITVTELKFRYGQGSVAYALLRKHPRASEICITKLRRKLPATAKVLAIDEAQHMDLV